jgi:hypothetical protein
MQVQVLLLAVRQSATSPIGESGGKCIRYVCLHRVRRLSMRVGGEVPHRCWDGPGKVLFRRLGIRARF